MVKSESWRLALVALCGVVVQAQGSTAYSGKKRLSSFELQLEGTPSASLRGHGAFQSAAAFVGLRELAEGAAGAAMALPAGPVDVLMTRVDNRGKQGVRRMAAALPPSEVSLLVFPRFRRLLDSIIPEGSRFDVQATHVLGNPLPDVFLSFVREAVIATGTRSVVTRALPVPHTTRPERSQSGIRNLHSRFWRWLTDRRTVRVALKFFVVPVRGRVAAPATEQSIATTLEQVRQQQLLIPELLAPRVTTHEEIRSVWGFAVPTMMGRIPGMAEYLTVDDHGNALLNFVMQLPLERCDLHHIQRSDRREGVDGYVVKRILQLASSLATIGVVHMDLRDENILVAEDGELLLSGFHRAVTVGTRVQCSSFLREPSVAPEIAFCAVSLPGDTIVASRGQDAWSVGMLLLQWLCGNIFYHHWLGHFDSLRISQHLADLHRRFQSSGDQQRAHPVPIDWLRCRKPLSEQMKSIIESLLDLNPRTRARPQSLIAAHFSSSS
ncbi:rhoptry kinase family protein ROP11 (incomplete catalytic triad) [Besnoitia besnoiti]|uniref:Rhoptry kinase family protein ROP11 (Incomplete catalytic triad) n=1 Tax=Besnoitia besnoiti TaxID=94643 RepID=A0A2A9MHG0_BESBE|nr:rhoptry kinase family protein ROP11 (incomplete catalytic triad) [Besnoitia besnoiti]PFH35027.1 rhoptry kinase family protein ROP11 (incomplete catalytic triad) [Besnoitia besnoiti]